MQYFRARDRFDRTIEIILPQTNASSNEKRRKKFHILHKINSKITILMIYEPNCSHCKEFVPKLHDDIYQKFKNNGLEIFAIYSMDDKEEWNDFDE